jgi:hypothetical protein
MCDEINPPRNRSRCRKCGAVKGYGIGFKARVARPR